MKILSVHLENFASYDKLDFNFDDQGLTLIHGATGSGKSTLCDAIPWTLFGVTAKNGKADEVKSWHGGATSSLIITDKITIFRSRSPNDLWFIKEDSLGKTRGKDLQDTQKMINDLLGIDADLYLAGAYFHEFSQTAQFFTTSPKNRREITEKLVDLSLPIKLTDSLKFKTKAVETELASLDSKHLILSAKARQTDTMFTTAKQDNDSWAHEISNKIAMLQSKADSFELGKAHRIADLTAQISLLRSKDISALRTVVNSVPKTVTCEKCGVTNDNLERVKLDAELRDAQRLDKDRIRLINDLEMINHSENVYQTQVSDLKSQANPFTKQVLDLDAQLNKQLNEIALIEHTQVNHLDDKLNYSILQDTVSAFRSELVRNTIEDLERLTVAHLRDYFDGEISVNFAITDNEKLDVTLFKDGNECSFTQLSKGQRQMLKLCFGAAVMECISNHHGIDFNQLFFDEALDGLDDSNKMKAIKLLETFAIKHGAAYIVEHSETVKALVDNKYFVELIDGRSTIS